MKKILLSISIILFTITLPLSAMHHDSHKNHGPMPFQKAMDKMHKDMMIKPSGNIPPGNTRPRANHSRWPNCRCAGPSIRIESTMDHEPITARFHTC